MDNLEKELKEILSSNGNFDAAKSETLRKEIVRMWYDKNMRKVKWIFWIYFVLCLGMMVGGYFGLRSAEDMKEMFLWMVFFMIGFNSTILMKLWYWIANTKLGVLKEIKQLQLQIAEQTGNNPPAEG